MNRLMGKLIFAALCVSCFTAVHAAESSAQAAETTEQRDARMSWWRAARFGMFVHWGVYSVPAGRWNGHSVDGAGEWIMHDQKIPLAEYQKLPAQFDPEKFDADKWVQIAQEAGMKYIVITAKHHDGFAMFHSRTSSFNIFDATPFKRDPLAELAAACQKHGIKLGFYYSQAQDWNHPGGAAYDGHWDKAQDGSMDAYIQSVAVPQVRELLTNYGPVAVLWWDTPVDMNPARAAPLLQVLKLQPGIISNDRLGDGPSDTNTPEQRIPPTGIPGRDWETCMTINGTWGYKIDDNNFKSTETLLHNLIDIASKGGNYLLNVGPTSLGEIPDPEVDRLKQIGQWLATNGGAIYGTTASPFRRYSFDGRFTVKGNRLFVHVFHWPSLGIQIAGLKTPVTSATFLDGGAVAHVLTDTDAAGSPVLTILPPARADPIATVVELNLTGSPEMDPSAIAVHVSSDGILNLDAEAANIQGSHAQIDGDHIGYWTDAKDFVSWDVVSPAPGNYSAELTYSCDQKVAGSDYVITAGQASTGGRIEGTGTWEKFVSKPAGRLHLKAGAQTVVLKAITMPGGAVMNLKALRLTRVE